MGGYFFVELFFDGLGDVNIPDSSNYILLLQTTYSFIRINHCYVRPHIEQAQTDDNITGASPRGAMSCLSRKTAR